MMKHQRNKLQRFITAAAFLSASLWFVVFNKPF